MSPRERPSARGEVAAPDALAPRADPIDYIAEEHLRQREICAALDRLAALDPPDADLAIEILHHLNTWLPRHFRDEEEDLFPLLRRRSQPGDDINDTLDRLAADHAQSTEMQGRVRRILEGIIGLELAPSRQDAELLVAFAAGERRHLIVENAIVLPLARARFTARDRRSLRLRMLARRGGETPPENADAG